MTFTVGPVHMLRQEGQAKTHSVAKSHGFVSNTLQEWNQTNNILNLESENLKGQRQE